MAKTSRALGLLPHWHLGSLSIKALVAECMAATLFVYIGTGTATTFSATEGFSMAPEAQGGQTVGNVQADVSKLTNNVLTNGSWGVTTALAFGLAITVMAYATGHLSGGQINPAVSLSLFVGACNGCAFMMHYVVFAFRPCSCSGQHPPAQPACWACGKPSATSAHSSPVPSLLRHCCTPPCQTYAVPPICASTITSVPHSHPSPRWVPTPCSPGSLLATRCVAR